MKTEDTSQILNYINDLSDKPDSLVIFDLDSTLYNVSPRTYAIVQSFCTNDQTASKYPLETKKLASVKIQAPDWGFSEALERIDFKASINFFKDLSSYWRKHFFSNAYMTFDKPYKNSSPFVQNVSKNIDIEYLTGRSKKLMLEGSISNLIRDKFPIKDNNILKMKEDPYLPDHIFKTNYIKSHLDKYKNIILFENEPTIINMVLKEIPQVKIVFIDSTHSRKEQILKKIPTINMDYSPLI